MLEHGVIGAITFDERAFVLGFRVSGKWRGESQGAQGKHSRYDFGREAHIETKEKGRFFRQLIWRTFKKIESLPIYIMAACIHSV